MWYNRARSGQAALEYVLAFAALLVVVTAIGFVLRAAGKSAERTERLVQSDYP